MPKRTLPGQKEFNRLNLAVEKIVKSGSGRLARNTNKGRSQDNALLLIAERLRDLPREEFKASLKANLERSASMATLAEPITASRTFAMPRLTYKHVATAIDFYTKAFGAVELFRFAIGEGIPHAEIKIGDTILTLSDEWPEGGRFSAETLGQSPVQISLRVENVDTFASRGVAAGLKVLNPVRDQFYGRREGSFEDPFGYTWNIGTVTEEMSVEEMHRRFRAVMREKPKPDVEPVPKGYRTLTPYVVAQNADGLIDFIKTTFGAEEKFRSVGGAGGRHAEIQLGDSMMMIGGGGPGLKWRGESNPGAFHVYVRDADAVYKKAVQAGAETIQPPTDQAYGERSSSVKDKEGNYWYIATRLEGDYKWEGAPDVQPYLHPLRGGPMINFLKKAFGAEDLGQFASPDGVIHHATLKIGSSHLELGEAQGPYQPMKSMFYLYVPDCDSLYHRAIAAGATSITEPMDQPYGDRSGGVKDAFGNQWYIATHIKDMTP
jgi:PhnB protein